MRKPSREMYRATYFCVVEGNQEKKYLEHLQKLLNTSKNSRVTITAVDDKFERILKEANKITSACLFDYDNDEKRFQNCLYLCKESKKRFQKNVFPAYSNICFDLWLVLHKEFYNRYATTNSAYISELRKVYKLNSEDDIKKESVIDKILSQITLDDVKTAIENARRIRSEKLPGDGKIFFGTTCYPNPDLEIYNFIDYVITNFENKTMH